MNRSSIPDPVITTPLTRRLRLFDNVQWHQFCGDFERRAVECYESYGYTSKKCEDYLHDLRECLNGMKRHMRVNAMSKERLTQYREGTRKDLFAPPPADDAY